MDWNKVDTELAKYLKTYKRKQLDLKDNLQNILDLGITDYNAIVTKADLSRFKRFLEKNKELVKQNDYIAYMTQKYLNKSKINYYELVRIMILVEYGVFEHNISPYQLDTLENIVNVTYEDIKTMCEKKSKKRPNILPWVIAGAYLLRPNEKGLTYQEQNNANTIYNAEEMYKKIIIGFDMDPILENQRKREITKKKDTEEYHGYIDDESTYLINNVMAETYKAYDFEYCKFVAKMDSRTTKMCKSLDRQLFSLTKLNTYKRYSDLDGKKVIYRTIGMKSGENLPPIINHFHWCRSHIEPWSRDEK